MNLSKKTCVVLAAAAIGLYLLFSLAYLRLPGLECDETIFVNPALGNLDGTYVEWHLPVGHFDIPVMIMRYIGAVKCYLYAPIFALFGTSVTTVRLPVVLLGLVTLGFTYATVKAMLGGEIALLSSALLATDPSFIFANRLDWGPNSLMMVFKTISLFLLWRWLTVGKTSRLALAAFVLGVGLFDKVVFVWFVGALLLAFPICFWPEIKPRLRRGTVVIALASFLAGCSPLIAYNIRFPLQTFEGQKPVDKPWAEESAYRYRLFRNTFQGSEVLIMMNEQLPEELANTYRQPASGALDSVLTALLRVFPIQRSLTAIALALSLMLIGGLMLRARLHKRDPARFFFLLFLLTAFFIAITPQEIGTHHVVMVFPISHVLIALATWEAYNLLPGLRSFALKKAAQACLVGSVTLVLLAPVVVDAGYLKAFKARGGSGRWSDAIYAFDDYVNSNPDKHFLLMDWGFSTQLLVERKGKLNWEEAFVPVLDSPSAGEKVDAIHPYLTNPDDIFVFHQPPFATFPILEPFQKALTYYGLDFRIVAKFSQRDGRPIYLLGQAVHPALELHRRMGHYFYFREAEDYDACSGKGVDYAPTASRKRTLGNYWGRNRGDFAVYRWRTPRAVTDATLAVRYSSETAHTARLGAAIDGRDAGTLEMGPTGGFGYKAPDWKLARLNVGNLGPGEHELRIEGLEANRPVNLDYFYIVESDFEYLPPDPVPNISKDSFEAFPYLLIQGFQDRPEVAVKPSAPELTAGQSTFSVRVVNLDAAAIDVFYTLDGKYMPIVHGWKLDKNHTATVFVGADTPKGHYIYQAIRDSRIGSPTAWIRVNASVFVK